MILLALGCASGMESNQNPIGVGGAPNLGSSGQGNGTAGNNGGNPITNPINSGKAGMGAAGMDTPKGGMGPGTAGMGPSLAGMGPGTAGMGPGPGTAGMDPGTAGMGPMGGMMGGAGSGSPTPTAGEPIVPELTAQCPEFRNGTINFMGLGGITVQAGTKASGPTAPMIFYWHGTGSFSGEYSSMAAAVHRGTMQEGGVLISFQGTKGGDLLSGTAIFGAGDFELADQLVACAVKNHNIDPKRIHSTGCSAGGLFAGAMGAMRNNYMASVAPNSGGWTTPTVRWQNMTWTPALMTVHGAPGVDVVIIDFSNSSKTADTAYKNRGGFVINCNHGGIHCGGGGLAGDIWEFFKTHTYGVKPSPWEGGLPSGFSSQCKIFTG